VVYALEEITNENGAFIFYRDKNERQIVVQLK
jgi:hypothetical protein